MLSAVAVGALASVLAVQLGRSDGALPPLTWDGAAPPTPREQVVVDDITRSFRDTGSCAGEGSDADDEFDVIPIAEVPDIANVVCRYDGGYRIVFSRFQDSAALDQFVADRLIHPCRDLPSAPSGTHSAQPPWFVDLPPPRPGRAFGASHPKCDPGARRIDAERVEIGWHWEGSLTFAYAFLPRDDFAALYRWWSELFLPRPAD